MSVLLQFGHGPRPIRLRSSLFLLASLHLHRCLSLREFSGDESRRGFPTTLCRDDTSDESASNVGTAGGNGARPYNRRLFA